MKYYSKQVKYQEVEEPVAVKEGRLPIMISKQTRQLRLIRTLDKIREYELDGLLIYADREHGDNFAYLTGFVPRFEEAVLALYADGKAYLMLGNEMLSMNQHCQIPTTAVLVPYFSLPNQPMGNKKTLSGLFKEAGVREGMKLGMVGWKMFTSDLENNEKLFDVPSWIVEGVRDALGKNGTLLSMGKLFIDPDTGVRTVNNANEIANLEYGAGLASACVLNCLNRIRVGVTELELADELSGYGQPINVQKICAVGDRFTGAVVEPRNKKACLGDRFSVTMGLRGGLTSRAGYIAENSSDLPCDEQDYLEAVAFPYYAAAATWYSTIGLDVTAGELYNAVDEVMPKETYHWTLNPGHLTATEEWMSSPVYKGSTIQFKSGNALQMDIIPSVSGYGKAGAEDGIALADLELREQIASEYPIVWERILRRRKYMEETLGIKLKAEVLPLSDLCGYFRPFLLNKTAALKVEG